MLSLDHLNDEGYKEIPTRKNGKPYSLHGRPMRVGGTGLYTLLIKNNFPEGYQTLCFNHQWKKRIEKQRITLENQIKTGLPKVGLGWHTSL
jgi:hypothetical protein